MLFLGVLFVLSPFWLYMLDQMQVLPLWADPLTWSLVLGLMGVAMVMLDQATASLRRSLVAGVLAALVLVTGIYGVVLHAFRGV